MVSIRNIQFQLIIILLCFNSLCSAQSSSKAYIDSMAQVFLDHSSSSCIVIGIIDHGKEHIYSYGNISKADNTPANDNTIFEIGSITQLFTAAATAEEKHLGKLKYDDYLSTYLSGVWAPNYHGKEIRIIDLLHHTSGLPVIPDDLFSSGKNRDSLNPYAVYNRNMLDSFISGHRLDMEPGTKYVYSNLGFGLMGDILSRIEAKPYENIIKDDICTKLGMQHTCIKLTNSQMKAMAAPYTAKGQPGHFWDYDALAGAGAIRSDMTDMLKFLNAAINPEELKDTLLKVSIKDCETMTFDANKNLKVGLAWNISNVNGMPVEWHNGGTGGYRSFIGFNKENETGVVVLTNSGTSVDRPAVKILYDLCQRKN